MPRAGSPHDAYIRKAAPFARPVLQKLRELYREACPDVQETIKWGFPHFEHKGILGSMAAFKAHVSFGFWKGALMRDRAGLLRGVGNTTMAAVKVIGIEDLPDDRTLIACIREAVRLNDEGVSVAPKGRRRAKPLKVPADFSAAMKKSEAALAAFEAFSPSHRNEYVQWITEAKRDETRQRRIAAAIRMLARGKSRNWKYERR